MDGIYGELDEVEVDGKMLGEECEVKTELAGSLREVCIGQLAKHQEEKLEFDNLAKELHAMSEEICELRKLYEKVQSSLYRKDMRYNQICSSNEKLQAEYNEKILKLEGENRDLLVSSDEAFARIQDLEKKTVASYEEISGLKRLLSIKQLMNLEKQKNASIDQDERDEYILRLEEESRISHNQLKWKREQFSHLEEAHKTLQTLFQVSKSEWQKEKSSLLDEISSLQGTLDTQIHASESLGAHLRVSNQVVANEESRRKVLEIEVLESRSKFENVFLECQAAKTEIDQLTVKRDEGIGELLILFSKKEFLAKELKRKIKQLEQENNDMLVPLRNYQEIQFNGNDSLEKLKSELQCVEQLNGECVINLTEKEAELNSQIEKLVWDMNYCFSQLAEKNRSIRGLHKELEHNQSLLGVKNREVLALIMVLKSEYNVAYSKLYEVKEELEMGLIQNEEKNMILDQQLQLKNTELLDVRAELERRSDEVSVLIERVESLESLIQKENLMEEEFRRYKAVLDQSKQCQSHLQQQFLELENAQAENIKNAVERVNFELQNKTSEIETLKIELQKSESAAEILKLSLKENQQAHEQEKTSLLAAVSDKDANIGSLEQHISFLESEILAKSEAAETLNQEKDNHIQLADDRNCIINNLQNEIAQLQNKLVEREVTNASILDDNNTLGHENERLISSIKEKDKKTEELQKELESLDQHFKSAMISIAEKEVLFDEALKEAECQKILEVEEKNRVIANLEKETNRLCEEVEFQEKSLLQSTQVALRCEETKKSEIQELRCQLEKETRWFENLLEELESHKRVFLEDQRKEKLNGQNFVAQLEKMCQQIGFLCTEDVELMNMLGKLSPLNEAECEPATYLLSSDGLCSTPHSRKSVQVSSDKRIPLTELNVSST